MSWGQFICRWLGWIDEFRRWTELGDDSPFVYPCRVCERCRRVQFLDTDNPDTGFGDYTWFTWKGKRNDFLLPIKPGFDVASAGTPSDAVRRVLDVVNATPADASQGVS